MNIYIYIVSISLNCVFIFIGRSEPCRVSRMVEPESGSVGRRPGWRMKRKLFENKIGKRERKRGVWDLSSNNYGRIFA